MLDGKYSAEVYTKNIPYIEEAYKLITGLQIKILTEITFLPFWEKGVKFFIAQGPNLERLEFAQYIK